MLVEVEDSLGNVERRRRKRTVKLREPPRPRRRRFVRTIRSTTNVGVAKGSCREVANWDAREEKHAGRQFQTKSCARKENERVGVGFDMASIALVELELSHRRNSGVSCVGGMKLIVEDSHMSRGLGTR